MIELIKEKLFSNKNQKLDMFKSSILYDKSKQLTFTCAAVSIKKREYDIPIYIGLDCGYIICLLISKQRSVKYTY
jgi:hypothetical protein